jgi:signal transduction histidine kinase
VLGVSILQVSANKGFRQAVAQSVMACLVLTLLTFVCYRLHLNIATACLLYVIVVVFLARVGNFASAVVASIIAALCLAHLAPPAYSFRVGDPLDDVAIAAFLTTSLVIARLVSKLREMRDDIVSSVNRKLIEAEEKERTRIGKDLDHNISQRMTLLALQLQQLGTDASDQLRKESSEISTDIRALAQTLYPSNLEYLGLVVTMKAFCREFAVRHKVEIDFGSHDVPSPPPLGISLPLFRVLQEALDNSAKHSGEQQFKVELFGTPGTIHLIVSDLGVGFDPKVAMNGNGFGLTSMRDRLKLINGAFSIDSRPKRGTKIHASVPLRE